MSVLLGLAAGYEHSNRKSQTPLVKFIEESEKARTLLKYGIVISSDTICAICGDVLSVRNIGAIIQLDGKTEYVCTKKQCMTVSQIMPR